jgi:hypothetical protein
MKEAKICVESAPAVCETCGKEFDRPVFRLFGKEVFRVRFCHECNASREEAALAIENQARQRAVKEPWERICRPRYRNFDRRQLPIMDETIDRILNWRPKPLRDKSYPARIIRTSGTRLPMTDETINQVRNSRPSPSADGRGLALIGTPHLGKRRLLFALGENLFHEGFQIAHISAPDFESLAPLRSDRETGSAIRKKLTQFRSAEILIFTDVGAEKLTESAQRELYALIEHRAQQLLPILWSTQFSRDEVATRFTAANAPEIALARGRAAVDRLNEVSDVITVERKSLKWVPSKRLLAQA